MNSYDEAEACRALPPGSMERVFERLARATNHPAVPSASTTTSQDTLDNTDLGSLPTATPYNSPAGTPTEASPSLPTELRGTPLTSIPAEVLPSWSTEITGTPSARLSTKVLPSWSTDTPCTPLGNVPTEASPYLSAAPFVALVPQIPPFADSWANWDRQRLQQHSLDYSPFREGSPLEDNGTVNELYTDARTGTGHFHHHRMKLQDMVGQPNYPIGMSWEHSTLNTYSPSESDCTVMNGANNPTSTSGSNGTLDTYDNSGGNSTPKTNSPSSSPQKMNSGLIFPSIFLPHFV